MKLALFDLDGTLLPLDSDHAFGEFMVHLGWADAVEHARLNDTFFQDYQAGRLDIHAYIDFATDAWRHRSLEDMAWASQRFMDEVIRPALRDSARDLVEQHRREGDVLAVVTATNDFITRPIAQAFGIEHLLATELERDDQGRPTGKVQGTATLREGKVSRVEQWLTQRGTPASSFESITFYGDSTNDLPLLEWVSHPVATNPGPALAAVALQRGWPVLQLFT
jgi:HAD superfamily hydrolase (TIGR01490 family)